MELLDRGREYQPIPSFHGVIEWDGMGTEGKMWLCIVFSFSPLSLSAWSWAF